MSFNYMKTLLVLSVLLACLSAAGVCHAQLEMNLDTSMVSFGSIDKSDLDAGFVELTPDAPSYALSVTVTDPEAQDWILYTRASDSHFTASTGVKPCGDLQWRLNGLGSYSPYTTSDAAAATGNGNATVDFDFKMLTSWADRPDTYGIDVVFTISN